MSDKDVWVSLLYKSVNLVIKVSEASSPADDRASMIFYSLRGDVDQAFEKLGFSLDFELNKYVHRDSEDEIRAYLKALGQRLHELEPLLAILAPDEKAPKFPSWVRDD